MTSFFEKGTKMKEKLVEILLKWLPSASRQGNIISWGTIYDGYEITLAYVMKENSYQYGIAIKCDKARFAAIENILGLNIKKYPDGFSLSSELGYNVILTEKEVKHRADRMFMFAKMAIGKDAEWKDFSELVEITD